MIVASTPRRARRLRVGESIPEEVYSAIVEWDRSLSEVVVVASLCFPLRLCRRIMHTIGGHSSTNEAVYIVLFSLLNICIIGYKLPNMQRSTRTDEIRGV